MSQKDNTPETIDLTPTWTAVMPIMIAALQDGTEKGKESAKVELTRLARIMDELVAERKQLAAALKGCLAIVDRSRADDKDAALAHVNARAALAKVEGIRLHVTMQHGGQLHEWIRVRYHDSPETLERVAHVLNANGYTVQRDETDGSISAIYNGEVVAIIQ